MLFYGSTDVLCLRQWVYSLCIMTCWIFFIADAAKEGDDELYRFVMFIDLYLLILLRIALMCCKYGYASEETF